MELRSVELIARALNAAEIQHLVVGGLAVNAHGYERFTHDIDLVIGLAPENITRGLHALMAAGYTPAIPVSPEDFAKAENRENWRNEKSMLVLKLWSDEHRRTPINVFIHEPFNFAVEWSRAIRVSIGNDVEMPVLCYQSLIEMKISAGREKDLLDVSALRKIDPYRG